VGSVTRKELTKNSKISRDTILGIISGILAMVFLALGIVIIKEVLEQSNVFWATYVRVTAGCVSLFVIVLCHPGRRQYFRELKFSRAWIMVLFFRSLARFLPFWRYKHP